MTTQESRPADYGPADEKTPGDGLSAGILSPATDDDIIRRAQLRRLLARIDVVERCAGDLSSKPSATPCRRPGCGEPEGSRGARPRPGDFTGKATAAELAEADERCLQIALACRSHARLLSGEFGELGGEPWQGFDVDVDAVIDETAVTR